MHRTCRQFAVVVTAILLALGPVVPHQAVPVTSAKGEDVCPEPNDDFQAACYLGPGSDALGFISNADDLDAYRFEAFDFNAKAHVEIADQPVPYQFVVANWNGDTIATSTTVGATEVADLTLPLPGSYYVFVQSRTGEFSDSTPYRILTRLEYATQPPPRAIYRGDFRAGTADYDNDLSTVEYVRNSGKLTIVSKVPGTRAASKGGGTSWLGSTADRFVLAVDTRIVSGTDAGFVIQFGALEPVGSPNPLHDQFYLTVDPQQQRLILGQFVGTTSKALIPWQLTPSIARDGKVNRTVLQYADGQLRVTVNGGEALTWTGQIPAGRFGVGSLNWGEGASVSFDNVLVTVPSTKPAAGTVLLAETFDDPAKALLSTTSPSPEIYTRSYEGGEYVLRLSPVQARRAANAVLPFEYDDTRVALDGRITETSPNNFLRIECRTTMVSPDVYQSYSMVLFPSTGRVTLRRLVGTSNVTLAEQTSPAVKVGTDMNHMELTCRGTTLTAAVNGVIVVTAEDSMLTRGNIWFGVGSNPGGPPSVEGRFDNLVVTQP